MDKPLDLEVVVPVADLRDPETDPAAEPMDLVAVQGDTASRRSIWPSIYPRVLELVREHASTIVFVNNRRLAERLALRLNELAGEEIALSHHGSLSREARTQIEEQLKAGKMRCLVATSSLELGIDMGAVDLVVQIESPKSVARGLQRIGRAGHTLSAVSKGRLFPKFRADLVECAVVVKRMRERAIEATRDPSLAARRAGPADRRDGGDRGLGPGRAAAGGEERLSVRGAVRGTDRERARHARRPLPLRGVRGAAAAACLGSHRGHAARTARLAEAGGHQRRHDPRPRPLRSAPAGWPARRRARRGDGLRGARRARRSASAPRPGASRRSPATA